MMPPDPTPDVQPDAAATPQSLLQRQVQFLRRTWWNAKPLRPLQRIGVLVWGLILIAMGCLGMATMIASTLNLNGTGTEAVAKLLAEFLLIPVVLLGLIIISFGGSLVVRSFVAPSGTTDSDRPRWNEEAHSDQD